MVASTPARAFAFVAGWEACRKQGGILHRLAGRTRGISTGFGRPFPMTAIYIILGGGHNICQDASAGRSNFPRAQNFGRPFLGERQMAKAHHQLNPSFALAPLDRTVRSSADTPSSSSTISKRLSGSVSISSSRLIVAMWFSICLTWMARSMLTTVIEAGFQMAKVPSGYIDLPYPITFATSSTVSTLEPTLELHAGAGTSDC
jgi:hypothetical protein